MNNRTEALKKDPEFLIRCALTHNWDEVEGFCSLLVETFTVATPRSRQAKHQELVFRARKQIEATDQWGNTALHAACYHKPPARVVSSILEAASAAPEPIQLHLVRARDGSTALQVACACGSSVDVIQAILNPPAGLLHSGCLVSMTDNVGSTPLSELVVNYCLESKSSQHRSTSIPLEQVDLLDDSFSSPLFDTFWTKVENLIQVAWTSDASCPSPDRPARRPLNRDLRQAYVSIVHGAAYVAEVCPPVLVELICRCYLHMVSFADRKGVLPLHLALNADSVRSQSEIHSVLVERRCFFVKKLLDCYPQAAQKPLPANGRPPFCHAIASGLQWHQADGNEGPLKMLWEIVPSCVGKRDPITGQLPFVLAASTLTEDECEYEILADDKWHLDTVYNLLRLDPNLLKDAIESRCW